MDVSNEDKYKRHVALREAIGACNAAADRLGVDEEARTMMLIAARASPASARACYKAILRSYGVKK